MGGSLQVEVLFFDIFGQFSSISGKSKADNWKVWFLLVSLALQLL